MRQTLVSVMKFVNELNYKLGGRVVLINISKMKLMVISLTMYIDILT